MYDGNVYRTTTKEAVSKYLPGVRADGYNGEFKPSV
jgi:hypothetical protein